MNHINFQTNFCVKFVPRTLEQDYVYITQTNHGNKECKAPMLGKNTFGGMQLLFLDKVCMSKHIIIHEAMHVLGFDHTHCRSDRDNFISIIYSNIKPGFEEHFIKRFKTHNELIEFDFVSIMMYSNKAFSKNKSPTILAKTPCNRFMQLSQLSISDIQMIFKLYDCQCHNNFISG